MMKRTLILRIDRHTECRQSGVLSLGYRYQGEAKTESSPPFQPPQVDEALPNVLLLGDSISIGYTLDVRKRLAGIANVCAPRSIVAQPRED